MGFPKVSQGLISPISEKCPVDPVIYVDIWKWQTATGGQDAELAKETIRPGLEPGIFGSGGFRPIHWASGPSPCVLGCATIIRLETIIDDQRPRNERPDAMSS